MVNIWNMNASLIESSSVLTFEFDWESVIMATSSWAIDGEDVILKDFYLFVPIFFYPETQLVALLPFFFGWMHLVNHVFEYDCLFEAFQGKNLELLFQLTQRILKMNWPVIEASSKKEFIQLVIDFINKRFRLLFLIKNWIWQCLLNLLYPFNGMLRNSRHINWPMLGVSTFNVKKTISINFKFSWKLKFFFVFNWKYAWSIFLRIWSRFNGAPLH